MNQQCQTMFIIIIIIALPRPSYPSCRHTTLASGIFQKLSQTVLHTPLMHTHTVPLPGVSPPVSLTPPSGVQGAAGGNDNNIHS